jgi:hypothetical protein
MGILKFLFKSKLPSREPDYEIVETHLLIDDKRYQVRIRKGGRELYAEDFFRAAKKPRDLTFDRLLLLNEKPPKPHFAPSLQEALDWFTGRKHPKDGYLTICWGDRFTYKCALCQAKREVPLRITQVERLVVARTHPQPLEIVGWRAVEVESELTGKGIPTKRLEPFKTWPVVTWQRFPNRYLCRGCARKMAEAGQGSEEADYFVFDIK